MFLAEQTRDYPALSSQWAQTAGWLDLDAWRSRSAEAFITYLYGA